jgi:hypothetical protein
MLSELQYHYEESMQNEASLNKFLRFLEMDGNFQFGFSDSSSICAPGVVTALWTWKKVSG